MNKRLQILQSEMARCQEELRFLGMENAPDDMNDSSTQYALWDRKERRINVTFANEYDEEYWDKIKAMKAFVQWFEKASTPFRINGILIQSVDMFGPRVGFLKIKADLVNAQGLAVPSIAFLRGGSVAILVIIEDAKTGKEYTVLTRQARVPIGRDFLEIPAGMMDDTDNFGGVAAKELEEETGIEINQRDLINLSDDICKTYQEMFVKRDSRNPPSGIYLSPGGCDEFMTFYAYKTQMSSHDLKELEGKATGELSEGESIKLNAIELNKLPTMIPDAKSQLAYALYMEKTHKRPEQMTYTIQDSNLLRQLVYQRNSDIDDKLTSNEVNKAMPKIASEILKGYEIEGIHPSELHILKRWAMGVIR